MRQGFIAVALASAATAGAALLSPVHAQEGGVYELGEIVVSSDRPVTEQVATHHAVTAEEIQASGARTLDEALLLLPGLDIRTGGQGVPRINLRGMRPRHVILLLDGIPMNSTFDGQGDPSFIPVENIAMIKLIPASGSVLYGPGGLGGVINIVTRRDGSAFSAEATGEAREGRTFAGRARIGGGVERVSYLASASWMDSDGFPSVSASPSLGGGSGELRENSDRRRFSAFGSLTVEPTQNSTLGLEVSRTEGAYGIPPGLIDDPDDPFARSPTYERVEDVAGTSVQLAGRLNPTGPLHYRAWTFLNLWDQVSARYDDATYSSMDDPTVNGTYREESRSTTLGAALQTIFEPSARGRLTLALSAERDRWESDLRVRDVRIGGGGGGGGGGGLYDVRQVHDDRSVGRYGVALEHEYRPTERSGLTFGVAHHWFDRDERGTASGTSAAAGGYYEPRPGTTVRASVARKIGFPSIRQLYAENGGNPALDPKRSDVLEAGVEQAIGGGAVVGVTLFRNRARGFIERSDRGEPYANHDEYLFQGVEVTAEARPVRGLLLRASYSHLDTEDRSPGAAKQELQHRPRHRTTALGRYTLDSGLSATMTLLSVADQVHYSRREPVEQAKLPDYTVVSARLAQRLLAGRAEVFVGADNLFDTAYEDQYGSPQATRTLYGGLTLRW